MDKDLADKSVPISYELAHEALPFLVLACGKVDSSALKTFIRDLELSLDFAFNSHLTSKCFKELCQLKNGVERQKKEEIYRVLKKERERSRNELVMFRKRSRNTYKLF